MRVSAKYLLALITIVTLGNLCSASGGPQVALEYVGAPRTFKVCALAVEEGVPGSEVYVNRHPLIFEGLRRCPLKPTGWDFENPLSDPQVVPGAATYTKSDAEYWTVELNNQTAAGIVGMDLVYISANLLNIAYSEGERMQRDALLKAARQGTIIWIDQADVGGAGTTVTAFAPPGPEAGNSTAFTFLNDGPDPDAVRRAINSNAWLLQNPFQISDLEVANIGLYPPPWDPSTGPSRDGVAVSGGAGVIRGWPDVTFQPIVYVSDGTTTYRNVAVCPYGAGAIVITAGEVGADLESWWQTTGQWWSADRLRRPSQYQAPDFKLAYNILASSSRWGQAGGARNSRAGVTEVRGPLDIDWQFPGPNDSLGIAKMGPVVSTPVCAGGMVFVVSLGSPNIGGEGAVPTTLWCFDADPAKDLDDDGWSDDGVRDYSLGAPYDLIWSVDLEDAGDRTPRYASVCVTNLSQLHTGGATITPDNTGTARPLQVALVSLVDPTGSDPAEVRAYCASVDPTTLSWVGSGSLPAEYYTPGALIWSYPIAPYDGSAEVVALSSPVVYEDYVYVLASEFDDDLDGASPHSTYGRAHSFRLSYRWDLDLNGARWVYPDSNDDPAGDGDVAGGSSPSAGDDKAFAELQGMLPPFHEPHWVAGVAPFNDPAPRPILPPSPGADPLPHAGRDGVMDYDYDVVLNMAAPVNCEFNWDGGGNRWQMEIDGGSGAYDLLNRGPGGDWCIVPTPTIPAAAPGTPPQDVLNTGRYTIYLNQGVADADTGVTDPAYTTVTGITRWSTTAGAPIDIDIDNTQIVVRNNGTRVYIHLTSAQARELSLPAGEEEGADQRPDRMSNRGVRLQITYDVDPDGPGPQPGYPGLTQVSTLSGPMLYWNSTLQKPMAADSNSRERVTAPVITGPDEMLCISNATEDGLGDVSNLDLSDNRTVRWRNRVSGGELWRFWPCGTLPNRDLAALTYANNYAYETQAKGAAAFDPSTDTAYLALNHARPLAAHHAPPFGLENLAQVIALNSAPTDICVRLRPNDGGTPDPDATLVPGSVSIATLDSLYAGQTAVSSSYFDVDPETCTVTIRRTSADWVAGGPGPMYGKPIWVTYQYYDPAFPGRPDRAIQVNEELHILPDIVRYQYQPYWVRLGHPFVNLDSVTVSLPNGHPVTGVVWGDRDVNTSTITAPLPAGWVNVLPRGLLDTRWLQIVSATGGFPLQQGSQILVGYDYFDENTGSVRSASELLQVPYSFGESVSSPGVSGRVLHVGTQGLDGHASNTLDYPETHNPLHPRKPFLTGDRIRETLLSVLWDPVSNLLRGYRTQSAIPDTSYDVLNGGNPAVPVIPATSSSPSIGHDRVFIGSNVVARMVQPANDGSDPGYVGEGVGFLSALKSQATYICDNTRIMKVVDNMPVWTCHGTLTPMPSERSDVARGSEGRVARPFSRPARALPLSNGNLLVVDTGNNRVVEIDETGTVLWPLHSSGYDYYTAEANTQLQLDSPSDAFRYYSAVDGSGDVFNSTNGDLLRGTVAHTLIADTGNDRIIDIITTVSGSGQQTHRVEVKTPSHIKASGGASPLQRISYTCVRPIFDPSSTPNAAGVTNPVIGYLCAASNLHQLIVVEERTLAINPPSANMPYGGSAGSNWEWLAWLYDADVTDAVYGPPDSLLFRNIRSLETSYEGGEFYITVTCGQYAGRSSLVQAGTPHALATQGDGVFEFCCDISGAPGTWALAPAVDAGGVDDPDTPIWHMAREDYIYSYPATGVRRELANIRYADVDGNAYWQNMPWFPVAARRLVSDKRVMDYEGDGVYERYHRHLVTNYAGLITNLTRENVADTSAPASLYSSIIEVRTNDGANDYPGDDILDIDRRMVIPDPNMPDWPDPLAQPIHATR